MTPPGIMRLGEVGPPPADLAELLRRIAEDVLDRDEVLAAARADLDPPIPWAREVGGATGLHAGDVDYLLTRDGTLTYRWHPWFEGTATRRDLLDIAAALATPTTTRALQAAVDDLPTASKDARRYIRLHGVGPDGEPGACLPYGHDTAQWRAIRDRLNGVAPALHRFWHPETRDPADRVAVGAQYDLFDGP